MVLCELFCGSKGYQGKFVVTVALAIIMLQLKIEGCRGGVTCAIISACLVLIAVHYPRGTLLPSNGHTGMCHPLGYSFQTDLV